MARIGMRFNDESAIFPFRAVAAECCEMLRETKNKQYTSF